MLQSTRCARGHSHISWLLFVWRAQAPSTSSMPSLMPETVAGVRPPHLAVWTVMPRCCVSRGVLSVGLCCVHVYIRSPQAADVKTVSMICVMLVSELGVPRRLRAVPISVACEKYWMFCGDIYLICEPLLLRPPYGRYREQLEYTLIPCGFLHWAGLQAPGGTLAAIYITLRR